MLLSLRRFRRYYPEKERSMEYYQIQPTRLAYRRHQNHHCYQLKDSKKHRHHHRLK
jgi:hypothetical protein